MVELKSLTFTNKKLLLSILFGILSAFLSKYGIETKIGEVHINVPWSLLLPILASMAWGWRYGLISGLAGGIYFPFILWPSDGWTNPGTSIIYLGFFTYIGFLYCTQSLRKKYLWMLTGLVTFSFASFAYNFFLFNYLLSLNSPLWEKQTIGSLPNNVLMNFVLVASINIFILTICAELLLHINSVRRLLSLQPSKNYNNNLKILLGTITIFAFLWLTYVGLLTAFLGGTNESQSLNYQVALVILLLGVVIVARIIFHYSESHVKTLDKLSEKEGEYRLLFEQANDAILILKEGVFIDCNSMTLKVFRCHREDIIGKTPAFFSPLKQPGGISSEEKTAKLIEDALHGIPQRFEWQHKRLDGSLFDVEVSLNRIDISNEIVVQSIIRDITEQKRANELARKLSTAVEQSLASIIITNNSGKIEYVNPKFTETTGYTLDEALGKNPNILKSGFTNDEEYRVLWKTILAGEVWKGEFKNTKKNGEFYWESGSIAPIIDESGTISHFIAIKDDITERKKVDQLLKDSEKKYRTIFENLHDIFYITDLDGKILEISPSIQFHYGYSREEMIGASVYDLYYDYNSRIEFIKILQQNGNINDYELTFKTNKNEKIYCSVNARLVFDENGRPKQIEGILRNITERKLTEEKIRINEQRFRKAQEVAKIGTFEVDVINQVTWGSDEAKKIFGFDLASDSLTLIQTRDCLVDKEKTIALIEDAYKNSNSYDLEYDIFKFGTKERRTLNAVAEIERNEEGKAVKVIGLIIDITDQKRMQRELIESKEKAEENERKLKEANEIAKLGSWELDIKTGIFTFTDNFYKIFHTTAAEMGGYQMTLENYAKHFVHPDDAPMVADETQKAIEIDGPIFTLYAEHRILYSNGETGYIAVRSFVVKDEFGKTIKTYGVNQDITEIKIAEKELIKAKTIAEESENRFRIMAEQSTEGITVADLEGKYIYVNEKFCEMSGYSREELLNMTVFDMGEPNDPKNTIAVYLGEENVSGEKRLVRLRKKDGTSYITEITGTFIEINKQKLILGSIRDISEIVKYQNELIKAKEKAEESDRLKSAFLANMSHEIRTPLNSIIGFSELLNDDDFTKEQKREFIETIVENGGNLLTIIDDIMDLSMLESKQIKIKKEHFSVAQLFSSLEKEYQQKAEKSGINFGVNFPADLLKETIDSDHYRVKQIFNNLISNSFKFTKKGFIEIGIQLGKDEYVFFVKDSGIGIAQEHFIGIFERFRQVDETKTRKYGGNGLGLAISKNLVEVLGGKIWLDSALGKGSIFYFSLPYNHSE